MVRLAGSTQAGDAVYDALFHAHAERLLARCDAVLRVGGPSAGADAMVDIGARLGLRIFHSLAEVPGLSTAVLDNIRDARA
jgi:molybdopterin biosynthesis enzyme